MKSNFHVPRLLILSCSCILFLGACASNSFHHLREDAIHIENGYQSIILLRLRIMDKTRSFSSNKMKFMPYLIFHRHGNKRKDVSNIFPDLKRSMWDSSLLESSWEIKGMADCLDQMYLLEARPGDFVLSKLRWYRGSKTCGRTMTKYFYDIDLDRSFHVAAGKLLYLGVLDIEITAKKIVGDDVFFEHNYKITQNDDQHKNDFREFCNRYPSLYARFNNQSRTAIKKTGEIHTAVKSGNLAKVKSLLANNPDLIDARDEDNLTPLLWAAFKGHKEIVEFLIVNGAQVNVKSREAGVTPLHAPAYTGREDIAGLLIENGANVNAKNKDGETPLFMAASRGNKKMVELLLQKGAELNTKSVFSMIEGYTPLHIAIKNGHKEIAEKLIEKGADINIRDKFGRAPLHSVAVRGYKEIAELLINKGADVNTLTNNGWTPLYLAITNNHQELAAMLRRHGGVEK